VASDDSFTKLAGRKVGYAQKEATAKRAQELVVF